LSKYENYNSESKVIKKNAPHNKSFEQIWLRQTAQLIVTRLSDCTDPDSYKYGTTWFVLSDTFKGVSMSVYFNSKLLPLTQNEYVAWVDIMGIGPTLSRSLDIASNFIFKLHILAIKNSSASLRLYPVMDGIYITCPDQDVMLEFLAKLYDNCAEEFVKTPIDKFEHKFLIRGALSYGPIIHGSALPSGIFQPPTGQAHAISGNANYLSALLIGLPMVQSHEFERQAPPFGIFVHESSRSFSPPPPTNPIHFRWWKWGYKCNSTYWSKMKKECAKYFDCCLNHMYEIDYDQKRIQEHMEMSNQYFG
jgi:hypothetical protein